MIQHDIRVVKDDLVSRVGNYRVADVVESRGTVGHCPGGVLLHPVLVTVVELNWEGHPSQKHP